MCASSANRFHSTQNHKCMCVCVCMLALVYSDIILLQHNRRTRANTNTHAHTGKPHSSAQTHKGNSNIGVCACNLLPNKTLQ